MSGHAQCVGHERLDHERSLEVRPYRVPVRCPFELGDYPERLDRSGCIARKRIRKFEHSISGGKGTFRIAVAEAAPAYDVRSNRLMDYRRIAPCRASQVRHRRKHFVLSVNQLARVLCVITRVGDHHRNGLADVSCLIDRYWIVRQGGLHDARKWPD